MRSCLRMTENGGIKTGGLEGFAPKFPRAVQGCCYTLNRLRNDGERLNELHKKLKSLQLQLVNRKQTIQRAYLWIKTQKNDEVCLTWERDCELLQAAMVTFWRKQQCLSPHRQTMPTIIFSVDSFTVLQLINRYQWFAPNWFEPQVQNTLCTFQVKIY